MANASTIICTTANIGETAIIMLKSSNKKYKHTINYIFGNLSGIIDENISSNSIINWTIPRNFYFQIPSSKTGTGTLTCITYDGSTEIGRYTTTFRVTTNEEECRPILNVNMIDINENTIALSGSNSMLIQYKSQVQITISAEARYGSGIVKRNVNNETVQGNIIYIDNVEKDRFTIEVIDSRGYTNSTTVSLPMLLYTCLTMSAEIKRTEPTTGEVDITFSGNYYNGSYQSGTRNTLQISWYYREKGTQTWTFGGTLSAMTEDNTYKNPGESISLGNIFDSEKSYEFKIIASDKLSRITSFHIVPQGKPIFDWGDDFLKVNKNLHIGKEIFNKKGMKIPEIQHGRVNITPSAPNTPTGIAVTFPVEFSDKPDVTVSPITGAPGTQVTGTSVSNISSTSFMLYITRINTTDTAVCWQAMK